MKRSRGRAEPERNIFLSVPILFITGTASRLSSWQPGTEHAERGRSLPLHVPNRLAVPLEHLDAELRDVNLCQP